MIRAEFTREIDALNQLRGKFKDNIKVEGDRQIEKLNEIKKKTNKITAHETEPENQCIDQQDSQKELLVKNNLTQEQDDIKRFEDITSSIAVEKNLHESVEEAKAKKDDPTI